MAALAGPIALSGWALVQGVITERRTEMWQALVLAVATVTPVFVLPFADNYLTQFVSIALWPFAMASLYAFVQRPTLGTVAVAAIALGAVAGTHPPLAPWFGPPALLLLLIGARRRPAVIVKTGLALGAALLFSPR